MTPRSRLREGAQSVGRESACPEQWIGFGRIRERSRDLLARLGELAGHVPVPSPVPVPKQRIRESKRLLGTRWITGCPRRGIAKVVVLYGDAGEKPGLVLPPISNGANRSANAR